ncbi:hypothetical protein R1flu_017063 [Riccia fluitans]|uniref:Serine hydrolase n=1 Tax=Riccia fluitans TaxID=41844 RepID=A0ABD1YSJ5_9MARC
MEEDSFLHDLLAAHSDKFGNLLLDPSKYRFQVLLSYEKCEACGSSEFVRHGYRVDKEYFYPASTIKLAAVVAAVNRIRRPPFNEAKKFELMTPLSFHPLLSGNKMQNDDQTNSYDQKITLAHTIRKLFLVSDNQAFNRLYALGLH